MTEKKHGLTNLFQESGLFKTALHRDLMISEYNNKEETPTLKPFSLEQVQLSFYFIGFGMAAGVMSFVTEILRGKIKK